MARVGPRTDVRGTDRHLDKTVDDSFPASDPPSHSGITGVRRQDPAAEPAVPEQRPPSHKRDEDARPTGQPTSDRHAAETAHAWEDEKEA